MAVSNFTVAVGPYTGSAPTQEVVFYESWSLNRNFDDGCTFTFSIPGFVPEADAISELDTDVWLYQDGVLDQRFRIIALNQSWGPSGEDVIDVQAVCYRRLLAGRFLNTDLTFTQISQGQIIWDLIDHTQSLVNGDLGITIGNLGPTVLRDRFYEKGQNILDIITDLCNVIDGPTWEIDANLQLFVSQPDLFPQNLTPIVLGATASSLARPSGASKFANVALVSGNQQETTLQISEAFGLPADVRGRWERRASFPSVILQQTLIDHSTGLLTEFQAPTTVWQVDVVPDRFFSDALYELGDFVSIVQPASLAAPVSTPASQVVGQILSMTLDQDANGQIGVGLQVMEVGQFAVSITGASSDVTANGYRVVTWLSSGSLDVLGNLDVEYLVVGGGGGGGSRQISQGGGGAGGLKTNVGGTALSLTTDSYAVVVGAGGAGGVNTAATRGSSGTGSSFGPLVSVSGGGGGGFGFVDNTSAGRNGLNGGSGGGGGAYGATGGTGISGEGFAGGNTANSTTTGGGGGGGAGGAGVAGVVSNGGNGGVGLANTITSSSVFYAGGGAGSRYGNTGTNGTGGNGGGGNAVNGANGQDGTDGKGGGGGAANGLSPNPRAGGTGGDGVVIVRWAV